MKLVMKNAVVTALAKNIALFKSDTNKLRIEVTTLLEDGVVGCKFTVCSLHGQLEMNLKVGSDSNASNFKPYSCCVSTSSFVTYLSALAGYDADVEISFEESRLTLRVPAAELPLNLFSAEAGDPLVSVDKTNAVVKAAVGIDFLTALSGGGYLSTTDEDPNCNRVAVYLNKGNGTCDVYSTNKKAAAKASFKLTKFDAPAGNTAKAVFGRLKELAEREPARKDEIVAGIKACQSDMNKLIAFAKQMGIVINDDSDIVFALSTAAAGIIQKVMAGTAQILFMVTDKYLLVMGGACVLSLPLAGSVCSLFRGPLDAWTKSEYSEKLVFDRDAMLKALSLSKLTDGRIPVDMKFSDTKVEVQKEGITGFVPVTGTAGDCGDIDLSFSASELAAAISKFPAGNVVLACKKEKAAPVLYSGDLTADLSTADLKVFVMPVVKKASDK